MGVIRRAGPRALAVALTLYALTVCAVLISSALMRSAHLDGRSLTAPVDALIVLGGGSSDYWGPEEFVRILDRREHTAARLMLAGKARLAVISEGGPTSQPFRNAAAAMRATMVTAGVPPERILLEERSLTTFQNMRYTRQILDREDIGTVAIVTDSFHLLRAALLAEYFLDRPVALVAAPDFEKMPVAYRVRVILREALAWWYNLAKVAAWEVLGVLGFSDADRAAVVK